MLLALIAVSTLLALVVAVGAAREVAVRLDPLSRRRLHRLVVTPADEAAFSGVLMEIGRGRDGHVVFADCRTMNGDEIAGDVIKARRQILSYQTVVMTNAAV